MNVTFHTVSAIGIAVILTDTRKTEIKFSFGNKIVSGFSAFLLGVISHGVLDYLPHAYPIKSIPDIIIGSVIILALTLLTNKKYRFITALAFLGCVFPDLVDELPRIVNKYTGLQIPVHENYFPWHWKKYSGSIYEKPNVVSILNHLALFFVVSILFWFRRTDLKRMFTIKSNRR